VVPVVDGVVLLVGDGVVLLVGDGVGLLVGDGVWLLVGDGDLLLVGDGRQLYGDLLFASSRQPLRSQTTMRSPLHWAWGKPSNET
jgi:hypothetical protein